MMEAPVNFAVHSRTGECWAWWPTQSRTPCTLKTWEKISIPGGSDGKESSCNAGDLGSIPGLGDPSRGGNGSMVTYSSILAWRIPINSGTWQATVHAIAKSRTWLSDQAQHWIDAILLYQLLNIHTKSPTSSKETPGYSTNQQPRANARPSRGLKYIGCFYSLVSPD